MDVLHLNEAEAFAVSPYLFGHNLEHTRACINGGLSAQMLRNRKFAGKGSKNEGCALDWFAIGGREAFLILEESYGKTSGAPYTRHAVASKMYRKNELQSQVVQNLRGGTPCGIGQYGLSLRAGVTYELRVVAKVSVPVTLTVSLTNRAGTAVYASTALSLSGEGWVTYPFTLDCTADDADACVRYTFPERGMVVFGALSMMPAGHFRGMRRDVVEHLKAIGARLLRWPGGNFAGEYRWQDGLLPVDMRGPLQAYTEIETQPYTHGYDYHEIGTDDFIALCREVGAEPFITINAVWNSPAENAAWVEYCNGAADTEYGRKRAENGHPEPYNVRFWSLGNEMGYGHMEGPKTPEKYAELAAAQADAMLAVTPDLKLFSSGPYPNPAWAEGAAKALKSRAPYLSCHYYAHLPMDYTTDAGIRRAYEAHLDDPKNILGMLNTLRAQLGEGIHISFDEWNTWYAWYRPSSALEGMFAAVVMHRMLQESARLDMPVCCYFEPVGEGAIQILPYESSLTGIGQVFALLRAHADGEVLPLLEADPDVLVTRHGERLVISLINRDYEASRTVRLATAGTVDAAKRLTAEDLLPHGHFTEESAVEASVADGTLTVTLPARSVTLVTLTL